jgi:hypothetical protein
MSTTDMDVVVLDLLGAKLKSSKLNAEGKTAVSGCRRARLKNGGHKLPFSFPSF